MKLHYSLLSLMAATTCAFTPTAMADAGDHHAGMDMDHRETDQQGATTAEGKGTVRSNDSNGERIVLAHEPMPSIG